MGLCTEKQTEGGSMKIEKHRELKGAMSKLDDAIGDCSDEVSKAIVDMWNIIDELITEEEA